MEPNMDCLTMEGYEGSGPYVFISYCRQDAALCAKLLDALKAAHIRFWYDHQINPGEEWINVIANHLGNCRVCVALMTKSFTASYNCNNELVFAKEKRIPVVPVLVDNVSLSLGMQLAVAGFNHIKLSSAGQVDFSQLLASPFLKECVDPAWVPGESPKKVSVTPGPVVPKAPAAPVVPAAKPRKLMALAPANGNYAEYELKPEKDCPVKLTGEQKLQISVGFHGNQVLVKNLDKTPILVDRQVLAPSMQVQIRDGSVIRNQTESLVLLLEESGEGLRARGTVGLLQCEKNREERYVLGAPVILGRDSVWARGTMEDDLVDGKHCIVSADNGFFAEDQGSLNGTILNGKFLEAREKAKLSDGDVLQMGRTLLKFHCRKLVNIKN